MQPASRDYDNFLAKCSENQRVFAVKMELKLIILSENADPRVFHNFVFRSP